MGGAQPVHATSVLIGERAILIAGRSGAGKSDLALRLIDRGATLLSDDYTELNASNGVVIARPPAAIAGRIEIRGVGIIEMQHAAEGRVALLLDLDSPPERMPELPLRATELCGIAIPTLAIAPFEASAPIKAEHALHRHGVGGAS